MNEYPYPVLLESESSYKDDIKFGIEFDKEFFSPKEVIFRFNVHLNSNYLRENILAGKLKIIIKLQSKIYIKATEIDLSGTAVIKVPSEKLMENDTLIFTAYILASDEFELKYNNELIEIYDENYREIVKKNGILAISNQEELSYNPSNNDFIKFAVDENMKGKGYRINFSDKHINVYVSPEFNEAYGRIKNNLTISSIFGAHLVFEVFVYTLVEVVQQDNIEEEWYELFSQMFEQTGEELSDFKIKVRDEKNLQMDQIYACAHELTNYYIEKSIIMAAQRED